jgi:signal transduction histidine kinase
MMHEAQPYLVEFMMQDSRMICLTVGKDGMIQQANQFACSLSGMKLEGRPLNEFFIDFSLSLNPAGLLHSTAEKALVNVSTSSKLPETYYFRFYDLGNAILALGEANNEEVGLLRKNMLELNQELNNLTRELQKKNAELKKLNDLKNQFLGIAAHDLRNPIGIIMGYSDFLLEDLEGALTEEQINMLTTIQSTSEFMGHLLEELLDISAIESGKLRLDIQSVDLLALVKVNASLNSVIAAKKNIFIQVNSFETVPKVLIDANKIEQVMNNLISNAVKFSMPGTTVKVNLFLSGDHVTVSVADQGQGIPDGETDKLFKPFQRTSVKTTAGEKSTGLGLSIVRNIILGHHGKIWLESKVGVGTTFYFSLPINRNSEAAK